MKGKNGVFAEVNEILESDENAINSQNSELVSCADYRACLQHSGIKTAIRYLAKDSESQWRAIQTISNRMWAILVGVTATFFVVLMQLFTQHIK